MGGTQKNTRDQRRTVRDEVCHHSADFFFLLLKYQRWKSNSCGRRFNWRRRFQFSSAVLLRRRLHFSCGVQLRTKMYMEWPDMCALFSSKSKWIKVDFLVKS